jgi:hypothetical protein
MGTLGTGTMAGQGWAVRRHGRLVVLFTRAVQPRRDVWVPHTGCVTQPDEPAVVDEQLVLVDSAGLPTEDRTKAVGGEVTQHLADGSTRSTLFAIER